MKELIINLHLGNLLFQMLYKFTFFSLILLFTAKRFAFLQIVCLKKDDYLSSSKHIEISIFD